LEPPGPGGVLPASPFISRKIPLGTKDVAEQKLSSSLFHLEPRLLFLFSSSYLDLEKIPEKIIWLTPFLVPKPDLGRHFPPS
jgi:hypothetical protein